MSDLNTQNIFVCAGMDYRVANNHIFPRTSHIVVSVSYVPA